MDAPRRSPGRSDRKRAASRSPLGNGIKREKSDSKQEDTFSALEREIRFELTSVFSLCSHSDKEVHVSLPNHVHVSVQKERLELVQKKISELKAEMDSLPKDSSGAALELEEVDCGKRPVSFGLL